MKTKLFLLLLLLVTLSAIRSSCGEGGYNPNYPGELSDRGVILISTDNGVTWQEKVMPANNIIISSVTGTSKGTYICVGFGYTYISTDFGNTWAQNYPVRGLDRFITSNTMNSALAFGNSEPGLQGVIRTTNNGLNWVVNTGEPLNILSAAFTDVNTGIAVSGWGNVYKTTNEGVSWSFLAKPIGFLSDITGYGQTSYLAGNEGKIAKTTNGGLNWSEVPTGIFDHLRGIACFYNDVGVIAVGDRGNIIRTVNGGLNWTSHGSTIEDHLDVARISSNIVISVCASGTIYRSEDYGVSWTRNTNYTTLYYFTQVYFDYITGRVLIAGKKQGN
jgi:photosystem II stability/assembly factor-like uncharacterized protein